MPRNAELNNREKGLITWFGILIPLIFISTKIFRSVLKLVGTFLGEKILMPTSGLFTYATMIVFFLRIIGFWNITILKDTLFWLIVVALPLF